MDQDNYIGISLVDLFAYLVKKFFVLLAGALIGMVLLLSFHILKSNTEKQIEAYEKSISKYKAELSSLEDTVDILNLRLESINEIESNSPLFSNEALYASRIMITVDSDKVIDSENGNNVIGQELSSFWNNLDLAFFSESDLNNDVLKASVVFKQVGQSVSIIVYSEDKSEAEKFASKIVDAFISYFDARGHLNIGSKKTTTSLASKSEIATIREEYVSDKAKLLTEIFDTEARIKELKKAAPSKYHPLRNAVIGFFVGGIIVAGVLGIRFVLYNPVTCSFNIEKTLNVPFLGAFFIDNKPFSNLARRIMVERSFISHDDSVKFLRSFFSTKSFVSDGNKKGIALISSADDKHVEEIAKGIVVLLKEDGYEVTFIRNSSENPMTLKTIEDSESVIFLERQWISRMLLLSMNKELASKLDKKILGFIIC